MMHNGFALRSNRLVIVLVLLFGCRIALVEAQLPSDAFLLPTPHYSVGAGPTDITASDFDRDGVPDLAVANGAVDSVTVLLNQGNGTFLNNAPAQNIGGEGPVAVGASNLDGQRGGDLVFANEADDSVTRLLNNGDGTFGLPQFISFQVARPVSLAAAHLNGDSHPDLAVANLGGNPTTVSVLLNDGSGGFATSEFNVGVGACCTRPRVVRVADLDGDGDNDLVVAWVGNFANGFSDSVSMLLNDGSGTFAEDSQLRVALPVEDDTCDADNLTCHVLAMTRADLTGDGLPDLAIAVSHRSGLTNANRVFILLNNGNDATGTWLGFTLRQSRALQSGADPRDVIAADLDGDGDADLITANRGTNNVSVLLNRGDGTFAAAQSFAISGTNPRPVAITAADLDGDCDLDLAVANRATNTVAVLRNQIPQSCPTRDLNADGLTDIVWRNTTTGKVLHWLLDGTTRIATGSPGTISNVSWQIKGIGDVNGDRRADLVWHNANTGKVRIWLLDGLRRVASGSPGTVANLDWQIKGVCDANGDRKADLVWHNASTGQVSVWLLDGLQQVARGSPGTFSNLDWQITGVGDVNDDNRCDIVWRHRTTGEVRIWLLDGTTRQAGGSPGTAHVNWQIVGVGDTNGDGNADLIWHHTTTGEVRIWLLDGLTRIASGSPGTVPNLAWQIEQVGDTNGDGKADLVWHNGTTGKVQIWLLDGVTRQTAGSPGLIANLDWQIQ